MKKLEVLLSEEQIQQKVSELAATISQAYGQRTVHVVAHSGEWLPVHGRPGAAAHLPGGLPVR
jgi:hypothetical protein